MKRWDTASREVMLRPFPSLGAEGSERIFLKGGLRPYLLAFDRMAQVHAWIRYMAPALARCRQRFSTC